MTNISSSLGTELLRRSTCLDRRRAVPASALDKPNIVLIFASSSRVRLTHLGVEREGMS